MDLERDAKRKAFKEILELAQGGVSDSLKARSPKFKAAPKADEKEKEKPCSDCEEGVCEVHDAEGFKSKLASLYEKLAEE